MAAKNISTTMLSELQGRVLELERALSDTTAAKEAAEVKAGEVQRLWEAEVAWTVQDSPKSLLLVSVPIGH